jgi:RimJ/RimL family protein N-acetyltransferase
MGVHRPAEGGVGDPPEALSVRELREEDIPSIARYWVESEPAFLKAMGVDLHKIPTRAAIGESLRDQLTLPVNERNSYCLIWMAAGVPIGHCNTNPTTFGHEAFMHLHLWEGAARKRGAGTALLTMNLPRFFTGLELSVLYSEPYALNPAPNRTLERVGFEFVKEHRTTPGSLNFEQPVKRWAMTRSRFEQLGL